MHPQYIKNSKGKKIAVILSVKEYDKLILEAEELESIKAYDKAKRRTPVFIPAEEVFRKLENNLK